MFFGIGLDLDNIKLSDLNVSKRVKHRLSVNDFITIGDLKETHTNGFNFDIVMSGIGLPKTEIKDFKKELKNIGVTFFLEDSGKLDMTKPINYFHFEKLKKRKK